MRKAIFIYSLLAFGYFGFSIIPVTEVSAQTIAITSGNNQSTTRGGIYSNTVTFTVTNIGSKHVVCGNVHPRLNARMNLIKTGTFVSQTAALSPNASGEVTIYVKADIGSLYDTCKVRAVITTTAQAAEFTGKVTDVLYFSGTSTTRSVNDGTARGTDIGAAVSATHWINANADPTDDVTLTYTLAGTDAASFDIDASTGQLRVNTDLNYYIKSTYSVIVKVEEKSTAAGLRSSDTIAVTINVNDPELPLVENNPIENQRLTVKRVDNRTVTLSWNLPTGINARQIIEYQYSTDGGQTWTSTRSTNTSITLTDDGFGNLSSDKFKIRAVSLSADRTQRVVTSVMSGPAQRKIKYECPVGWTRESRFGRTPKALIYELKVNVDRTNRGSIYQLESLAIYVHPEEGLETLDGWTLKVGTLYNNFGKAFKLTAENSVIDEHDFAYIENPEGIPIPMGTLDFIGQSLPSFDYRLYDAQGTRVDFGISCYKEGGLTFRLWNTKDPRVIRVLPFEISEEALSVRLKALDWNTPYFRTEWTAAIMPDLPEAPAAPSLMKKSIVGTWGDLKKQ